VAAVALLLASVEVSAQFCHKKGCAARKKVNAEISPPKAVAEEPKRETPPEARASPALRKLSEEVAAPSMSVLSFSTATVTNVNLGGQCGMYCPGPLVYDITIGNCAANMIYDPSLYFDAVCERGDEEVMIFEGLGSTDSGHSVDLHVRNTSEYIPWNANQNGVNGDWGNINVLGNEPVTLEFCFIDHATGEKLVLDNFTFTFVDFDNTATGYEEELQFVTEQVESYKLLSETTQIVSGTYVDPSGTSMLSFRSSERGIGKDNPVDLDALYTRTPGNAEQQKVMQERSVVVNFLNRDCFTMQAIVAWPGYQTKVDFPATGLNGGVYPAGTGRNLAFALSGSLIASPSPPPPPWMPGSTNGCPLLEDGSPGMPSNIDCRSDDDCPQGETCIAYRNRRLVHGKAVGIKDRLRKHRRQRKLLFSGAPNIGSCGC